jgi:hypothetical protein
MNLTDRIRLWLTIAGETLLRRRIDRFRLVLGGHIYFQTLSAAVQLDLFSLLDENGPMTEQQLCSKLGIAEQPCRILLLGLASIELIQRDNAGIYRNTYVATKYFARSSNRNLINIVKWQHFINYKAMYHFHDALLSGKNVGLKEFPGEEPYLYGRLAHQPPLEKIFQDAMEEISRQASENFSRYVDLSSVKFLVDVGGGNASNIMTIARVNPHLKAAVFDSPTVCGIATANIAKNGLSDRLSALQGDCFKDAFPPQADAILFCHFFTIWSLEENLTLLKRAFASLPPGGRAMIFNMMQDDDRSGPLSAALGSPYFLTLATGKGMLYSWAEYQELFRQAGFINITTQKLPVDHGVIVGYKPS